MAAGLLAKGFLSSQFYFPESTAVAHWVRSSSSFVKSSIRVKIFNQGPSHLNMVSSFLIVFLCKQKLRQQREKQQEPYLGQNLWSKNGKSSHFSFIFFSPFPRNFLEKLFQCLGKIFSSVLDVHCPLFILFRLLGFPNLISWWWEFFFLVNLAINYSSTSATIHRIEYFKFYLFVACHPDNGYN